MHGESVKITLHVVWIYTSDYIYFHFCNKKKSTSMLIFSYTIIKH